MIAIKRKYRNSFPVSDELRLCRKKSRIDKPLGNVHAHPSH